MQPNGMPHLKNSIRSTDRKVYEKIRLIQGGFFLQSGGTGRELVGTRHSRMLAARRDETNSQTLCSTSTEPLACRLCRKPHSGKIV